MSSPRASVDSTGTGSAPASPARRSTGSGSPSPGRFSSTTAAVVAVHTERITRLDGELKGLRAQFTEFHKNAPSPHEVRALRDDVQSIRLEGGLDPWFRERQREQQELFLQLQQGQQQQAAKHTQLQGQVEALTKQLQAVHGHGQDLAALRTQLEPLRQQAQQVRSLRLEHESLRARAEALEFRGAQDMQQLLVHIEALAHAVAGTQGLQQEQTWLKTRSLQALQRVEELRGMHVQAAETQREVVRLRQEVSSARRESLQKPPPLLLDVVGPRGPSPSADELGNLKATMQNQECEMWSLRRKLYDAGVLAPPRVPEAAGVPSGMQVGTLELGQDVFTARLLLHLGLQKGKSRPVLQARMAGDGDGYGSETTSSDDGSLDHLEDSVIGLRVPEVDPSSRGCVNIGWSLVCMSTMGLQALIVWIHVRYGPRTTRECLLEPLQRDQLFLLRASKATATLAVGALVSKDLMGVINCCMAVHFLEASLNLEAACWAAVRTSLIILLAGTNVLMIMNKTTPAEVWYCVTMLAFVGELSSAMFVAGKQGMFGHSIRKAATSLNFSLRFKSGYPRWFPYARWAVLSTVGALVICFVTASCTLPDRVCTAVGPAPPSAIHRALGLLGAAAVAAADGGAGRPAAT